MNNLWSRFYILITGIIIITYSAPDIFCQNLTLHFINSDSLSRDLPAFINKWESKTFKDSVDLYYKLDLIKNKVLNLGYAGFSIDSYRVDTLQNKIYIDITPGLQYFFGNLLYTPDIKNLIEPAEIQKLFNKHRPFNYSLMHQSIENILRKLEDNGYPFAKIRTDSSIISENQINLNLQIEYGDLILFDSIHLENTLKLSKKFLYAALHFRPGSIYNESKIKNTTALLNNYAFIQLSKPPRIEFNERKAVLHLHLISKKANQFYGIAGFLPDYQNQGKTVITGELSLLLVNSFSFGEKVEFEWHKPQKNSQNLFCHFNIPFIGVYPVGFDANFDLLKQDTLYLTYSLRTGIVAQSSNNANLIGFYRYKKSTVLNQNTIVLSQNTFQTGYSSHEYGISFSWEKTDYKWNPGKGFFIHTELISGKKSTTLEPGLPADVIAQRGKLRTSYEFLFNSGAYIPLWKKKLLGYLSVNSARETYSVWNWNANNDRFFDNEMFLLGGLKNIRGYDDRSLKATSYAIFSAELRFRFEQNSNLFLLFDKGITDQRAMRVSNSQKVMALGAGITFETKAGLFTLIYAVGQQPDQGFLLKSSKIHFGYISRF